jgi:hypothetical protein
VAHDLLEIRELAELTGLSPKTVERRLAGTAGAATERRGNRTVRVWRLEDVRHVLVARRRHGPRSRDLEPLRADEERLSDAAKRLGMGFDALRRRIDRMGARWRYARVENNNSTIALPLGELGRLGLEAPRERPVFEVAGVTVTSDVATLDRTAAGFVLGVSWDQVNTLFAADMQAPDADSVAGQVGVDALVAVLHHRCDAVGCAVLIRLLDRPRPTDLPQEPDREAFLLAELGVADGGRV